MAQRKLTTEELAFQQRLLLLEREQTLAGSLLALYAAAHQKLSGQLDRLVEKIEAASLAGLEVTENWLWQEARLESLLAQIETEIDLFASQAQAQSFAQMQSAVPLGAKHASELLKVTLGSFDKLPKPALKTLAANMLDSRPLGKLFQTFGADAAQRAKQTLFAAVAAGENPRPMASSLADALETSYERALTITRTESLRAYRESTIATYQQNADVLDGWEWLAEPDESVCAMCLAMDGSIHPLEEEFASHPACRCTSIPCPAGVDRTRETGADWFEQQTSEVQDGILGRTGGALYRSGAIGLNDFVQQTTHPEWGDGRQQKSLKAMISEGTISANQVAGATKSVNE